MHQSTAERSTVENGKLNGHANGTVTRSEAQNSSKVEEEDLKPDGTTEAFLPLEEERPAKASVIEVFKKVL